MPPFYNDDENASDILGVVVGMVGGGSLAGTGAAGAAAGAAAAVVAAEDEESVDAAGEEKTEPSLAAIGPSGRFVRRPPPEHHRPQHHNEGQRLDENRREGDHDDDDGGGVSGRDEGCETEHGARSRSEGRIPGSGGPRLRDRCPGGGGDSRSDEEDACAVAEPLESANRCRAEPADARTAAESMTEAATAAPPPTTTPPQRSYMNSRGDLPLWSHGKLYGAETTVPLPTNSRRRGRLTTIPERKVCIPERRVTFASAISENTTPTTNLAAREGATMVDDTNNKNHHDHDAREREILLEQTATIPHVSEYTPRDKRKMWYTKKEMSSMRLRCVRSVLVLSRYRELYCPSFFRGLETLVQELVAQHRGDDDHDDACGGESFPVSATERRRWGGVSAVLIEQRRQRYRCLETHGVVYAGMASPEQVRRAYAAQGRTSESSSIARGLALLDEADAREWLLEQSTGDENDARHWYRESPDPNDSGKPKRHASIDHRHCDNYYETDETDHRCFRNGHGDDESHLPRGLRWALETLLGSFLELRIGDVYLGMGEQFF